MKPNEDVATGIAADPSGNSSGVEGASANSPSSAMEKAAALVASAMDPAAHLPSDGSQQGSSTIASANNSQPAGASTASAARPETLSCQWPQPLPQSLSDIAKAGELYQRVGGSEMHIAMETDLLGAVDLRATMHQSALTQPIGVQRADVQACFRTNYRRCSTPWPTRIFTWSRFRCSTIRWGAAPESSEQQEAPARNPFAPRGGYAANVAGAGASNREDLRRRRAQVLDCLRVERRRRTNQRARVSEKSHKESERCFPSAYWIR